jgi:hypothetical protein
MQIMSPSTTTAAAASVVCNGVYDHNIVPSRLAKAIPEQNSPIKQHVSGGFHLDDLVPGNILVVGSSQSGIQTTKILLDHLKPTKNGEDDEPQEEQEQRRQIYLSTDLSFVFSCWRMSPEFPWP